jgi:hypothetical protein
MDTPGEKIEKEAVAPEKAKVKSSISMHEDIPVWYDCCSCEAEPYWVEAMDSDSLDKRKP